MIPHLHKISVLQYNVANGREGTMNILFCDPRVAQMDILAIQEPWNSRLEPTTHHPCKDKFHLFWPPLGDIPIEERPERAIKTCLFVRKTIPSDSIQCVNHSPSLQTLTLAGLIPGRADNPRKLHIYNVYVPPRLSPADQRGTETLQLLDRVMEPLRNEDQLVVGDFNTWHEDWFGRPISHLGPHKPLRE